MKLRNKKTGEIVEYDCFYFHKVNSDGHEDFEPNTQTLAELNAEWEDYEEPKEDAKGSALDLMIITLTNFIENEPDEDKVDLEDCKQMLNKFKAWKRLKDKDFQFHGYSALGCGEITFSLDFEDMDDEGEIGELQHDLELLFGGEE